MIKISTHSLRISRVNIQQSPRLPGFHLRRGATRYTITEMNARQQTTAATYGSSLYGTWGFDSYSYPTWSKAKAGITWLQDVWSSFDAFSGGNLDCRGDRLVMES